MKTAIIYDSAYGVEAQREVYLIENLEDLIEYQTYIQAEGVHAANKMLKDIADGYPTSRLDHWRYGLDLIDSLVVLAVNMGRNPFWVIGEEINGMLKKFYERVVNEDQIIILNKKLSWRIFCVGEDEIIEKYDSLLGEKLEIVDGCSNVIQLENDSELDVGWIDAFSARHNCLYPTVIPKLRSWSHSELLSTLTNWVKSTPDEKILCQYTTGTDISQMHQYLEICIKAGIKKAEFMFSAGYGQELRNFIDSYHRNDKIKVTCLNL
jgi:hypothetical protein